MADICADTVEEIGGVARRDVFLPEFSANGEAWLDVWAYGVQELPDALLDITVRHPGSQSYQPEAATRSGHAAARGEKDKLDRHPPAGGRQVWPVAHESWGRLGGMAEQLLESCAAAASSPAWRAGRLPGNPIKRWRAQLDAEIHRGIAT